MGALTSAGVAITVDFPDRTMRRIRNEITLTFGDGSSTYPTNGVPLPAIINTSTGERPFALHQYIKRVSIEQPTNGFVYAYDHTHHTIRIFQSAGSAAALAELGGSDVPATVALKTTFYGA